MMKLQAVLSGFILTFCLRYSVYVSFIITGAFFGELRLFSIYKRQELIVLGFVKSPLP
ncbi:hypothetical protein DY000_02035295 [Brassica cretica]|uniref:Copper transporter n=1 Tax=Brassica cretica TaxID=69181 RepID=A0ABQ7DHB4_BRACR|nr:hypothetical protein DY000_02035295 [Brassica cretica]